MIISNSYIAEYCSGDGLEELINYISSIVGDDISINFINYEISLSNKNSDFLKINYKKFIVEVISNDFYDEICHLINNLKSIVRSDKIDKVLK